MPELSERGVSAGVKRERSATKREVEALARHSTNDALEVLREIMLDPTNKASSRVAAATYLIDRGHGKPAQEIEDNSDNNTPVQVTFVIDEAKGSSPKEKVIEHETKEGSNE